MTATLNPSVFAQMKVQGAMSTEFIPFPVGDWDFCIMTADVELWSSQAKGTQGLKLIMKVTPTDVEGKIREATQRDNNDLKWELMLDVTADGTGLDMGKGKNVRLGRLREKLGQNDPTKDWGFGDLCGNMVRLTVKHELYKGEPMARVDGLAPDAE